MLLSAILVSKSSKGPHHNKTYSKCFVGNNAGFRVPESVPKDQPAKRIQPIAVPAIPVDELKDITDNFGTNALIGEGSYGRVYHGVLKSGQAAAIKKLDSSKQPDQDFLEQVGAVKFSL